MDTKRIDWVGWSASKSEISVEFGDGMLLSTPCSNHSRSGHWPGLRCRSVQMEALYSL